jgi:hypothetical protein
MLLAGADWEQEAAGSNSAIPTNMQVVGLPSAVETTPKIVWP